MKYQDYSLQTSTKPETLGQLMKSDRLRNRLKQSDVAELLGCTQARVSEYESGNIMPSRRTVSRYINLLCLYANSHEYYKLFRQQLAQKPYNAQNRIKAFK